MQDVALKIVHQLLFGRKLRLQMKVNKYEYRHAEIAGLYNRGAGHIF